MSGFVKTILLLALLRLARWCEQNWELSLFRLLPLVGVVCAIVELPRAVGPSLHGSPWHSTRRSSYW